jgi:hypothetical protein
LTHHLQAIIGKIAKPIVDAWKEFALLAARCAWIERRLALGAALRCERRFARGSLERRYVVAAPREDAGARRNLFRTA